MVKNSPKIEHNSPEIAESKVNAARNRNAKKVNKLIEVTPEQRKLIEFLNAKWLSAKGIQEVIHLGEREGWEEWVIDEWETHFKIGVVSDTHLWAKTCRIKELEDFYKKARKEGVQRFFHAGDLADGMGGVYKGQLNELAVFGADDSLKYVKENYPNPHWDCITEFITGNHDEDFLNKGWVNFWDAVSRVREDMHHLWLYDSTVRLNGVNIQLHHWAWGGSYAKSYKIQKYVEAIPPKKKPDVYILGHYHGSLYIVVQGVHALLPSSFQWQSPFAVRLGLEENIGGYILEIETTPTGEIRSFSPKYISYS